MNKDYLVYLVSKCTACITYFPLQSEQDYSKNDFPLKCKKNKIVLPHNKSSDPIEWANLCIKKFKTDKVFLFIPGTKFDIYGTRYGKGGGWYDRFLSKIPNSWIRIGIIDNKHFSVDKLERKVWDEPVDWIVVKEKSTWYIYKSKIL